MSAQEIEVREPGDRTITLVSKDSSGNLVAERVSSAKYANIRDIIRAMCLETPEAIESAKEMWQGLLDDIDRRNDPDAPKISQGIREDRRFALTMFMGKPTEHKTIEGTLRHEIARGEDIDREAIVAAAEFIEAECKELPNEIE